jgi:tetratricopeptide (TPR) repeat protein
MARREDQALEQLQKALDLDPNFGATHQYLGLVYEKKKRYEEAIVEFQKLRTLFADTPWGTAALGHACAMAGKRGEAQRALDELKELAKLRYVSSYDMAVVYMGLGEKDQALAWLEKAYEQRDGWLAGWVKVDPRFDGLRSDPKFAEVIRRIGFPE